MAESAVVSVRYDGGNGGNVIEVWDKSITNLENLLGRNEYALEYHKRVRHMKTFLGEDLSRINVEVAQCEWLVKQNTFQIKFKTLERQIVRMIRAKTFDPVREAFLKRYDEMCRGMCDIYEEGVSLDEMTESDYRDMVDDIMAFRNIFHPTPD